MSNKTVSYFLPTEWKDHFVDGLDADEVDFASCELEDFLEQLERERLIFNHCAPGRAIRSPNHDTPGYQGDELMVYEFIFTRRSDSRWASKRPVKIGNTKLPLPKDCV
jgi:hypothetical protein